MRELVLRSIALPALLIGALLSGGSASTPDAAIAEYFTARFAAMDASGPTIISLISAANPKLIDHTRRDLTALHSLLYSFRGVISRTHDYRIDARRNLVFDVYEQSHLRWDDGPNGVRTSGIGYAHRVELAVAPSGGYVVLKDAFRGVGMDSPDVDRGAPPTAREADRPGRPNGYMYPALSFGTYNRDAALTYVNTWWNSRNPNYNNYGGNDCANFMSQGLQAGSEVTVAAWQPYTDTWINADKHHGFFANGGRGADNSSVSQLTLADLIYYNWPPGLGYDNQQWDHAVMVTAIDQYGQRYVSGHSPELGMQPWDTWMALYLRGYTAAFTSVFTTYSY